MPLDNPPPCLSRRLDISDNPFGSPGAEALAALALASESCRLHELRMERCGVTAAGRLALVSCSPEQASSSSSSSES